MTEQDGFAEAVLLFDADLATIDVELHAADFQAMVEGSAALDRCAASLVKAAFVVVGAALAVRSVVFFTFKVDENGAIDRSFNLPLRYLADNAGPAEHRGAGTIRLACRGQCPVPWHTVKLWQPLDGTEGDSIQLVQQAVWRNHLGLKPTAGIERAEDDALELRENTPLLGSVPAPPAGGPGAPVSGSPPDLTSAAVRTPMPDGIPKQQALESRLTETFGTENRVNLEKLIRQHNERINQVSDKYRAELLEQQQGYLNQIRSCREEIRELRSALRHEQQRSRRLQALLRGEP